MFYEWILCLIMVGGLLICVACVTLFFFCFYGLVGFVLVGGWFSVWLLRCCVCDGLV